MINQAHSDVELGDQQSMHSLAAASQNRLTSGGKINLSGTRIVSDLLALCTIILPLALFETVTTPYQRAYYCDDKTIQLPFHPSTISAAALYVSGCSLGVILFALTELHHCYREQKTHCSSLHSCKCTRNYVFLNRFNVHRALVRWYRFTGWLPFCVSFVLYFTAYFALGALCNALFTDILKHFVGRLRPNFIAVCQPSAAVQEICANTSNIFHIVLPEQQDCQGKLADVNESRRSFPSGHSSAAFYCAVFIALYIQSRVRWRVLGSRLLICVAQFALIVAAVLVGLSRILDNKHHWQDVLAGAVIGIIIAYAVVFYCARAFSIPGICHCAPDAAYINLEGPGTKQQSQRQDTVENTNQIRNTAATETIDLEKANETSGQSKHDRDSPEGTRLEGANPNSHDNYRGTHQHN